MSDVKVWRVFHAARYDEREEGGFIKGKCVEEYDGSWTSWGHPHMVAVEDYEALRAQVEALRAKIKDHNDDCLSACVARGANGNCEAWTSRGMKCCDCPADDMIEIDGAARQPPEGAK